MELEVRFLGTGTSQGVPVIGCTCAVCRSTDPRDQRLRTSVLVKSQTTAVVIDVGPDFRQQMLRAGLTHLDAVLLTHEHNDHIIGLDDVRPFNFRQRRHMPVFGYERVCRVVQERFSYIFDAIPYPGAPRIDLIPIDKDSPLIIGDLDIQPLEVLHGGLPVLGFRFGSFAYITDAKVVQNEERKKLTGLDVLVVNALHHEPHETHFNLEEALDFIRETGPRQAYLVHASHHMGTYREVEKLLPPGVSLAYDDLTIQIK